MSSCVLLFARVAIAAASPVAAGHMAVVVDTTRTLNTLPDTFVSFGWEMDQMRHQVSSVAIQ
jgi:hypothetical protein